MHHLGYDFGRDDNVTLHFAPRKHIKKMIDYHVNMLDSKPNLNFMSPLEKGYHRELDASEHLDQDSMQKFQHLVGSIQWAVSLGSLDANAEIMTLASFRAEPRQGHLDRSKRVISYVVRFKHATARTRT